MLKFSFNSTTLRNMNVTEALRNIKAYGYDGVELTLNDSHFHPLKHETNKLAEIKNYCLENDIAIVCVAAGGDRLLSDEPYEPSLIHPEKQARMRRIDFIKRAMEAANYLEVPVFNFNSGKLRQDISPDQAAEFILTGVQELLSENSELTLVIEPEPGFYIGTTTAGISLIKQVNNPRFQLNLDIGHVFCSEEDCYGAIERALPYARNVHIEDIKNRVHHHEIPGEGDIDFAKIMKILREFKYNHYISVELHHHDQIWERALKESLEYLRKLERSLLATAFPLEL